MTDTEKGIGWPDDAPQTEYWVLEVLGYDAITVARFDDEDRAFEWAKAHYDNVYETIPVGVESGAFIQPVHISPDDETEPGWNDD